MSPTPDAEVLSAPNIIEYPFTRTTGPVIGAFMTGLREGVLRAGDQARGKILIEAAHDDRVGTHRSSGSPLVPGDSGTIPPRSARSSSSSRFRP